mgnify:CR=1 FL=1
MLPQDATTRGFNACHTGTGHRDELCLSMQLEEMHQVAHHSRLIKSLERLEEHFDDASPSEDFLLLDTLQTLVQQKRGLIIVVGLSIGMITPPVAINLYVASSVTQLPLERITQAILPYLLGLIGVLLLVVYVPILLGWSGH